MKFTVVTLFPDLVEGFLRGGLMSHARERGLIEVATLNPRDFTSDVHRTVDDRAFGGGDGMVMKPEPLAHAVESLQAEGPVKVVVLSPHGQVWSQTKAHSWSGEGGHVALVCGRYAGIDQRFIETYADEVISLGDFILNGGELAALAVIESVSRLRPGVLGNRESSEKDSFCDGRLEAPQFTRPREWMGLPIPDPLLSGHHAQIAEFLEAASLLTTAKRRPDLLKNEDRERVEAAKQAIERLSPDELRALGLEGEVFHVDTQSGAKPPIL